MYVIRNKSTKAIIHVNPAPLQQNLSAKDVYFMFDANVMEIGKTDNDRFTPNFTIDQGGMIVNDPLANVVRNDTGVLRPDEKLVDGKVVKKTLKELIDEGIVILLPIEKFIDDEQGGKIVEKTMQERVNEGLIILLPGQKIENNQIVPKTLLEQVNEGLIIINTPFEFIEDNQVRSRTPSEALEEGVLNTEEYLLKALEMVDEEIETAIRVKYSIGDELKNTKAYLDWLNEEKPENDERETTYINMQKDITDTKAGFAELKKNLRDELEKLSS